MKEPDLFQTNELSRPAALQLARKALQQSERGELTAAAKSLQRAIDLDPRAESLEQLGEVWMKLNQPERAIVPLAAAATLNPKGGAASALAFAFMRLRRHKEAMALATQVLKRRPGDRIALEVIQASREGE